MREAIRETITDLLPVSELGASFVYANQLAFCSTNHPACHERAHRKGE